MKKQPTLRERALRLLARREHSLAELRRKLLSDERYAESRVHSLSRKFGAARIAHELRAKGLDKGLADQASKAARATEVERAREVWRRKFRLRPRPARSGPSRCAFCSREGFPSMRFAPSSAAPARIEFA